MRSLRPGSGEGCGGSDPQLLPRRGASDEGPGEVLRPPGASDTGRLGE